MEKQLHSLRASLCKAETWRGWIGIFAGCTLMAVAFVFFINPYNIVPGGVYGASLVLHNLFPTIQVGTFGYMFDIPLLIISALLLGAKLGARTLVAALTTPAIMNIVSYLAYPDEAALHSLDPSLIAGGVMDMSQHLMLSTVIGGLLIGVASGLIVRSKATSGGTDIVAMIMQKYLGIKFSTAILMADSVVVGSGLVVIGFGIGAETQGDGPSWILSFYSLIAIYVSSRAVAYTISGPKEDKLLFVISARKLHDLHSFILHDLERTATVLATEGLYSGMAKEMLMLVVTQREIQSVKQRIKAADPTAFVIVTDAYDTFGEGWKQLPAEGELSPE